MGFTHSSKPVQLAWSQPKNTPFVQSISHIHIIPVEACAHLHVHAWFRYGIVVTVVVAVVLDDPGPSTGGAAGGGDGGDGGDLSSGLWPEAEYGH